MRNKELITKITEILKEDHYEVSTATIRKSFTGSKVLLRADKYMQKCFSSILLEIEEHEDI